MREGHIELICLDDDDIIDRRPKAVTEKQSGVESYCEETHSTDCDSDICVIDDDRQVVLAPPPDDVLPVVVDQIVSEVAHPESDDDGVQFIEEVDVAQQRSLNAELVDLTSDFVSHPSPGSSCDHDHPQVVQLISSSSCDESDSSSSSSSDDSCEALLRTPARRDHVTFEQITRVSVAQARLDSGSSSVSPFLAWSEDMHIFYNQIEPDLVDCKLEQLLAKLPADADWSVQGEPDLELPSGPKRRSHFCCSLCSSKYHQAPDCPRRHYRRCIMCGKSTHLKSKCPEMACLQCGQPGIAFSHGCNRCERLSGVRCCRCGVKGHPAHSCPDRWRRFHCALPGDDPALMKSRSSATGGAALKWCCNCGREGHWVHQCRLFSSSFCQRAVVTVVSYANDFQQPPKTDGWEWNAKRSRLVS